MLDISSDDEEETPQQQKNIKPVLKLARHISEQQKHLKQPALTPTSLKKNMSVGLSLEQEMTPAKTSKSSTQSM